LSIDSTRIEALETKAAFQEDALQQLSDALIAQQSRIDLLEARVAILTEQVQSRPDDGAALADTPPPHY
jgi:SlyX protein